MAADAIPQNPLNPAANTANRVIREFNPRMIPSEMILFSNAFELSPHKTNIPHEWQSSLENCELKLRFCDISAPAVRERRFGRSF
jgi:hypothetical protein